MYPVWDAFPIIEITLAGNGWREDPFCAERATPHRSVRLRLTRAIV